MPNSTHSIAYCTMKVKHQSEVTISKTRLNERNCNNFAAFFFLPIVYIVDEFFDKWWLTQEVDGASSIVSEQK